SAGAAASADFSSPDSTCPVARSHVARLAPQPGGTRPGPGGPGHHDGPDTMPGDGEQDHARTSARAPREGEHG
ncbi:hypothetical protein PV350_41090, partial [Streptomyces sp. PA03-6a]|nr:hypothetical protein [Streptomyces sp. PA03-6a]